MVHLAALFLAIIVVSPLFVLSSENQRIGSNQQHLLNDPDAAAKLRISQLGTLKLLSFLPILLIFRFFFVLIILFLA